LPSISVVIAAYSQARWDDLLRAVASVQGQLASAAELIVVIDHNDELFEQARDQYQHVAEVRVIENAGVAGLSEARNTGVAAARGDVVAFLDDDAIARDDWLERLCAHYADPLVLGVGGAILPLWRGDRPKSFPPEFDWVVGCTYVGLPETTEVVRNLIGANMSFRRDVFATVGGFRSDIGRVGSRPFGCEETEFCLRASKRMASGRIVYEPLAEVEHVVPPERAGWSYFVRRCYAEGWSKALVSRLAGRRDGLRSERHYVIHTIPRGLAANLIGVVAERDLAGLMRALRIVVGVLATTAGYCAGTTRLRSKPSRRDANRST
jgi:glucosyl-dolichyl phosphate glucuronosyltransferase